MKTSFPSKKRPGVALRRGYTTVELLIALGVFAIGVTGVASMQKVTASSNQHARALGIATYAAQTWQDRLAIDATSWTTNRDLSVANTTWLNTLATGANLGNWTLPANVPLAELGPAFSAGGRYVDTSTAAGAGQVVFCTHVRVTPLMTQAGNGLYRTEVRVFWPREGYEWADGAYCTAGANATTIGRSPENFHFVYSTSVVRQTSEISQ